SLAGLRPLLVGYPSRHCRAGLSYSVPSGLPHVPSLAGLRPLLVVVRPGTAVPGFPIPSLRDCGTSFFSGALACSVPGGTQALVGCPSRHCRAGLSYFVPSGLWHLPSLRDSGIGTTSLGYHRAVP